MNLLTPADAGYTHVSNTILKELFLSMLKDTWKNITKSCHRTIYLKVHSKYTFKPLFLNKQLPSIVVVVPTTISQTNYLHSIQRSHFILLVLKGIGTYLIWPPKSC